MTDTFTGPTVAPAATVTLTRSPVLLATVTLFTVIFGSAKPTVAAESHAVPAAGDLEVHRTVEERVRRRDGAEARVPFVPLVPFVPAVPFAPGLPSAPLAPGAPLDPEHATTSADTPRTRSQASKNPRP